MARRCRREQVSQNTRLRPFSTAVVQVSGSPSAGPAAGAVAPQKSQIGGAGRAVVTVTRVRTGTGVGHAAAGPRQQVAAGAPAGGAVPVR